MSGALKFVKVIVALARQYFIPRRTLWKSAYKLQFMRRPPGAAAGSRTISTDFGRRQCRSSTCGLEPGPDTARADETADPPHLQINPAGGRYRMLMAMEGEVVRRPFVLVGVIADAEVESIEILRDRLIDQVLQQQMADAVAAERRVVGRENIIEPAAPDEAEMRRRHSVADRQRRKMADCAEPAAAYHLAIKALDAGCRQEIRR